MLANTWKAQIWDQTEGFSPILWCSLDASIKSMQNYLFSLFEALSGINQIAYIKKLCLKFNSGSQNVEILGFDRAATYNADKVIIISINILYWRKVCYQCLHFSEAQETQNSVDENHMKYTLKTMTLTWSLEMYQKPLETDRMYYAIRPKWGKQVVSLLPRVVV